MSRTILKFSSIVILAHGSSALSGTEYESLIGATIMLAMVAIVESVFRGITAIMGLRSCRPGSGTQAIFILGIIMVALDAAGLINTLLTSAQSAPASLIAVAMSGLYLFSVFKIRKENAQGN